MVEWSYLLQEICCRPSSQRLEIEGRRGGSFMLSLPPFHQYSRVTKGVAIFAALESSHDAPDLNPSTFSFQPKLKKVGNSANRRCKYISGRFYVAAIVSFLLT